MNFLRRSSAFAYGVFAYAVFLVTALYAIGFIGGFLTPTTLDGEATVPIWQALLTNTLLLGLFAVQHSVMARPAFKRWWTRFVPEPVERSTYVLFSSVALLVLFAFWQPIPTTVWHEHGFVAAVLQALFFLGVLTVLYATFLIDHFDLFGLRQVVLHFRGMPYTEKRFATPSLYRYVRHPLYVGWFMTLWFTPHMSAGHLLFAAVASAFLAFNAVFQHANIRTPRWLGYVIQRPESHGVHHERGVHRYNYSDLPLWDVVFGTFRNPERWEGQTGFYVGASSRVGAMLVGRDVSEPEAPESAAALPRAA